MLTQYVPSHLVIAGQRVLISYDGQPITCYGCGDTGHLYPTCPRRQRRAPLPSPTTTVTYATVAATMPQSSGDQPVDNIHGDSPHLLERVVESNDHNVDALRTAVNAAHPPWTRIRTRSWGNPTPPTSLHRNTRRSARSLVARGHRPPGKSKQKPGTVSGHLPGKGDPAKSRQIPATHCLPVKLASGTMTQRTLWRLQLHNTTTPTSRRTPQPAPSALRR
jgi:hypothetical protein